MDILCRTHCCTRWLMLASLLFFLSPMTLSAQTPGVSLSAQPEISASLDSADQLIQQGQQLENEGRWADALNLYQGAIKSHPKNQNLVERRTIARIHYDLERRYSDQSFREALTTTTGSESLNVYAEVLLKIQSYYVDQPNWAQLASYGFHSLEVAANSPDFRESNIPGTSDQQILVALDTIRNSLNQKRVANRHDTYVVASTVAKRLNQAIGLPVQSTIYEFTNGAIASLDPYSSFMSNSQYGEAMSQIEGNFVGLGVELRTNEDHLQVVNVIPGGPADAGNVAPNDRIIAVDGQSVKETGSEKAADMLRGIEGSYISITVERDGMKTQSVRLQRRRVEIPSVEEVAIIDRPNGIGYIRLTNFQKTTTRDFDAALYKLHGQGMKSLIVDVRGNPGGLLSASVDVANRFVSNGVIVSTRGRNPIEDYTHRAEVRNTWRIPLVVLIDEDSASASEIFAAAIRDHRRGTIVGRQSFGKGSVQGIFPLNVSGGGIRLTTAKFYSPRGLPISDVGVQPDVDIQYTAYRNQADKANADPQADDSALRVAVQVAGRAALSRRPTDSRAAVAGR